MMAKHEITHDDLMPVEDYARVRKEKKAEVAAIKKDRRMAIGPYATFYFECYETMLHQIQEMLHIERGGKAQIEDELSAYNPLVPKGRELVATVMFEIPDAVRRAEVLATLGGVEDTMTLSVDGEKIQGVAETDVDRTNAEGKASSVQFVHFPFTDAQVARFREPGAQIIVGIEHPNYAHLAVMPEQVRKALAGDFA